MVEVGQMPDPKYWIVDPNSWIDPIPWIVAEARVGRTKIIVTRPPFTLDKRSNRGIHSLYRHSNTGDTDTMSTYAADLARIRREKAARATRYTFQAAGADLYNPHAYTPENGAVVIKTQPHGCPKNGTFGQCYVADTEGRFIGMVDLRSLQRLRR